MPNPVPDEELIDDLICLVSVLNRQVNPGPQATATQGYHIALRKRLIHRHLRNLLARGPTPEDTERVLKSTF